MKVKIKQDKISFFGRTYRTYINDRSVFYIKKKFFSLKPKYSITDYQTGAKLGVIENKFLAFKAKAIISIESGTYVVSQTKLTEMIYTCHNTDDKSDNIQLIATKGLKGIIIQNQEQIGKWKKNRIVVLDGDNYSLELNSDVNLVLISALMVLQDTYKISISIGGDIGIDIGNIGGKLQPEDGNWKPIR